MFHIPDQGGSPSWARIIDIHQWLTCLGQGGTASWAQCHSQFWFLLCTLQASRVTTGLTWFVNKSCVWNPCVTAGVFSSVKRIVRTTDPCLCLMVVSSCKDATVSGHPEKPWQAESQTQEMQRQLLRRMPARLLRDKCAYLMKCVAWLHVLHWYSYSIGV